MLKHVSTTLALAVCLTAFTLKAHAEQQAVDTSQVSARAAMIIQGLQEAGGEINAGTVAQLARQADLGQEIETRENQAASLQGYTTANRVLLCVKSKFGAVFMKGEYGICSDLTGQRYGLQGTGLGLVAGAAIDVMTLIYVGRFDIPITGTYTGIGGSSGIRKSIKYAMKFMTLIKSMPKAVGPDIAIYSDGMHGGGLLQLGIQLGPMIDLSGSKLTLNPL